MDRQTRAAHEIDATDLELSDVQHAHRQRSARTDASMRDGDSGHGNPGENPEDEFSIDNDVGDSEEGESREANLLEMIPDRHGADGIDPDGDADLFEGADGTDVSAPALADLNAEPNPVAGLNPAGDAEKSDGEEGARAPFTDYADLKIPEVIVRVEGRPAAEIEKVIRFEEANRNRKTLLARLNRMLKSDRTAAADSEG